MASVLEQLAPVLGGAAGFFLGGPPGMIAGAGIGAGISGQASANDTNVDMAREANSANMTSAREQMAFQERMANSMHQREMRDLKNSGLNPILAAQQGSPTPSGASATAAAPRVENTMSGMGSSAMQTMNMLQGLELGNAQIGLTRSQTHAADASAAKSLVDAEVSRKDIPAADIKNEIYDTIKRPFKEGSKYIRDLWQRFESTAKENTNTYKALMNASRREYEFKAKQKVPVKVGPQILNKGKY